MRVISHPRLAWLVAGATLVLGAGIAAAVTLPDQASETATEAVSNAGPSGNSDFGQAVSDTARDPSLQGCEKGRAVAAQATTKAAGHRQGQGPQDNPCGAGDETSGGSGHNGADGAPTGVGSGSGGPGGGGGGGGSQTGSGGGSGGPGGGAGGGGTQTGSGGGSGSGGPATFPSP